MNNFGQSMAFAAIMTLYDELKQSGSKQISTSTNHFVERDLPFDTQTLNRDTSNCYSRLREMADSLFRSADAACNVTTDISADTILPGMFFGIFYEAIKDSSESEISKINAFEHLTDYCRLKPDFTGEQLFSEGKNQLTEVIIELANVGIQTILMAAHKSGRDNDGAGFVKILAELVSFAEGSLYRTNKAFKFHKKPAIIVLEEAIAFYEEQMKIMEEEDPTLKDMVMDEPNPNCVESLLNEAREYRKRGVMNIASQIYKEILSCDQQSWEATFYSDFCEFADASSDTVRPAYISDYADKIINALEKSIPLSKSQLHTRTDIINGIGDVAESIIKQSEHYFVATMNLYKHLPKSNKSESDKIARIGAIIRMLFSAGDIFEKYYREDREICVATAYACWHIAITCYESCNMPQPVGTYEHWMKMKKYDPNCKSEKIITPNEFEGFAPQSSSGGCYIATAVYGSYDCPQVWTLRRFRDYTLAETWYGRAFIRTYYAISPTLVNWFGKTKWFKKMWQGKLDHLVENLQSEGVESTPYEDKTW